MRKLEHKERKKSRLENHHFFYGSKKWVNGRIALESGSNAMCDLKKAKKILHHDEEAQED